MPSAPVTDVAAGALPPARTAVTVTPASGAPSDVTVPVIVSPWLCGACATSVAANSSRLESAAASRATGARFACCRQHGLNTGVARSVIVFGIVSPDDIRRAVLEREDVAKYLRDDLHTP